MGNLAKSPAAGQGGTHVGKTSMKAAAGQEPVGVGKAAKGVAAGDGQHGIGNITKEAAAATGQHGVGRLPKGCGHVLGLNKTTSTKWAWIVDRNRVSAAGQRQFGELAEGRELPCVVELGKGNVGAVGCGMTSTIVVESDQLSVGKISTKYSTVEGGLVVVQGDKAGSNATDSGQSNEGDGEGIATGRQGAETDQRKEGQLNANMISCALPLDIGIDVIIVDV
ncbi:hypothetical protein FRX31_035245 [Thalictrum thalictroides]|uniref:Uncharacterized protein n=1 Tax=Thalictrum thalictroides TaxID=46969 RepID=A0A7J6URJ5_THATH|nr:hypothetical protein FRX31_035245 [Thalictrum thalictroides]